MGSSHCGCEGSKSEKIKEEQSQSVQLHIYTENEKIYAKKIFLCFYNMHFKNRTKEINNTIRFELAKIFAFQKENQAIEPNLETTFCKKFEEILVDCRKNLVKFKLDIEFGDCVTNRNLNLVKDELINYYITLLEKNHLDLFIKLLGIVNEKKISKRSTKDTEAIRDSLLISLTTLENNKNNSRNMNYFIENDNNKMYFEITDSDRKTLAKEFDHLFDYTTENNSVLLNFLIEDGDYPLEIKKFITKFFFLCLMKKSECIGITKKYTTIAKKEIKKRIAEKNIDIIDKEEIIEEDYQELFEINNNTETESEKNFDNINTQKSNFTTSFKLSRSNLIESKDDHLISIVTMPNSTQVLKWKNSSKENLKSNLKKTKSPPFKRKTADTMNSNIFTSSNTYKLQSPSDISELNESKEEDIVEHKTEENRHVISPIHHNIHHLQNIHKLYKSNKKANDKVNSAAVLTNFLTCNHKQDHLDNGKDFQFYKGEYDIINFLYCGTGTLIKNKIKHYYYHGTFRIGKKNGYGIIYRILSENQFEIYQGEWTNNKQDGFGMQIIVDEKKKKKFLRKGKFENGNFRFGSQVTIEEKSNYEFFVEEYKGEKVLNLFHGRGTLKRKIFKANKFDSSKYDLEYEYEYQGNFVQNLENGFGVAKKQFKQQKYESNYEGEFLNGEMHGNGKIEYTGNYSIKSYQGIFENNNCFCVYGIVRFKSGDEYEGFFDKKHHKTNVGLYTHYDKDKKRENFFGRFYNDKKDGIGRFVSPNDYKVFVGLHTDGDKNGIFSLASNIHQDYTPNESNSNSNIYLSYNSLNGKPFNLYSSNSTKLDTKSITTELVKQSKIYYLFENDEIIDKSEKPIKE